MMAAALTTNLARPAWLPQEIFPFPIVGIETDRSTVAVSEAGDGPRAWLCPEDHLSGKAICNGDQF